MQKPDDHLSSGFFCVVSARLRLRQFPFVRFLKRFSRCFISANLEDIAI